MWCFSLLLLLQFPPSSTEFFSTTHLSPVHSPENTFIVSPCTQQMCCQHHYCNFFDDRDPGTCMYGIPKQANFNTSKIGFMKDVWSTECPTTDFDNITLALQYFNDPCDMCASFWIFGYRNYPTTRTYFKDAFPQTISKFSSELDEYTIERNYDKPLDSDQACKVSLVAKGSKTYYELHTSYDYNGVTKNYTKAFSFYCNAKKQLVAMDGFQFLTWIINPIA